VQGRRTDVSDSDMNGPNIQHVYFGNLFPDERQYKSGLFHGLALTPKFERDIAHDARQPLPFKAGSIRCFQSQDVFEHIERDRIAGILDDSYGCLSPGGIFRLSVPDYNSPLLRARSVYDANGNLLYDVAMGGTLRSHMNGEGIKVELPPGGDTHLWFPTYAQVLEIVIASEIRKCKRIEFYHYWINTREYVCKPFDQSIMPVGRCPPGDMRAQGKPISIIVDFVK
jgi:hypothetical protein